jgi:cation diffusion facilitator family transporter
VFRADPFSVTSPIFHLEPMATGGPDEQQRETMKESRLVVYAAIAANLAIAGLKFAAAMVTGSSAMLSEGIHSLVDTGDGVLLSVGLARSERPADASHPFGHGKELYFWTLIVAVLVFAVGSGMSMYEGIRHLVSGRLPERGRWTYLVLAGAALFEATSWAIAWRRFARERAGRGIWTTLESTKDPSSFAVLFEDSAALAGLAVAFAGIWLSGRLGSAVPDGIASILIGAILMLTALLLVRATRRLVLGESADPQIVEQIRNIAAGNPAVEHVGQVLTVHFGPRTVLAQIELGFARHLKAEQLASAIDAIQSRLKREQPLLKHVFIEAQSLPERA